MFECFFLAPWVKSRKSRNVLQYKNKYMCIRIGVYTVIMKAASGQYVGENCRELQCKKYLMLKSAIIYSLKQSLTPHKITVSRRADIRTYAMGTHHAGSYGAR
jgi:hypothetical protein